MTEIISPDAGVPYFSSAEHAEKWVRNISDPAQRDDIARYDESMGLLRKQIINVYGKKNVANDASARKVDHRMKLLGVLAANPDDVDPADRSAAMSFADDFADLVWKEAYKEDELYMAEQKARREEERARSEHQKATHDALTGLLNRPGLVTAFEELSEAVLSRKYAGLALLSLDLNKFKPINDTFGHDKGDAILKGVSAILRNNTRSPLGNREADAVARAGVDGEQEEPEAEHARVGGDEFVVLIPVFESERIEDEPIRATIESKAAKIASRLNVEITAFINRQTDNRFVGVGVAIGVAVWEGGPLDELLKKGDKAMYQIKKAREA